MHPSKSLALMLVVAGLAVAAANSPQALAGTHTPSLPASGAWFGAYVALDDNGPDKLTAVDNFQSEIGRKLAMVREYYGWDEQFPSDFEYAMKAQGQSVLLSWNAYKLDGTPAMWADIAAGLYDSTIDARATDVRSFNGPIYLIFNHEPEPKDGQPVPPGTPADFVAAWQHIHDRFQSDGVTNVTWVLTLLSSTYKLGLADSYYPGDSYVDVLATDGYNWYGCPGRPDPWTDFTSIFQGFRTYGIAKNKPMFIAEYGVNEDPAVPGRKAQWLTDAATTLESWPEIKAALYYHNGPPGPDCAWWVDSSSSSLAAFEAMGSDPYFNPPPPLISITSEPAEISNRDSATFTFTANVPVTYTCSLDGGQSSPCSSGQTYNFLSEGAHNFQVVGTDDGGNIGLASYGWTVDTVAPTLTILASPPVYSHDPDPSFNITSSEPSSGGFICALDSVPTDPCQTWDDYFGVPDGQHTFVAQTYDDAGNYSTPVSFTWTIDTVAPGITIVGPPTPYNNKQATFTLTSNEQGATFKCALDGGSFINCNSPKSYWVSEGPHTFSAEAIDLAGNTGTPANWAWSVDTTKPTVAFTSSPANPTNSTTASFSFTVTDVNPTTSTCQLDSNPATPCGPGVSSGYASDTFTRTLTDSWGTTKEGSAWAYTSGAQADFDVNGSAGTVNLGTVNSPRLAYLPQLWTDSEVLVRFQVDKMPTTNRVNVYVVGRYDTAVNGPFYTVRAGLLPSGTMMVAATKKLTGGAEAQIGTEVNIGSIALANTWYWVRARFANEGNFVRVQGKVWKDGTPEPGAYQLSYLDSTSPIMTAGRDGLRASPSATNTPFLVSWDDMTASAGTTYSNLTNALHTFTVTSTDSAGNVGTGVYSWTVDTVPPVATITQGPPANTNQTSATFKFTSNESGGTFTCKLDAGAPTACTSPLVYSGLTNGSHTFTVTAIDKAGNASAPVSQTWTVDTVPPVATVLTGPASLTNQKSVTFTFSSNETGSTFKCALDGASFTSCTTPKTYWVSVDGPHTFRVEAVDPAGNIGAPASWSWTLDATKPTVTINSGPSNPSPNATVTFTFSASEPNVVFSCQLDSNAATTCTSGITYSGITNGWHTFKLYGTDPAGNVSTTVTWGWNKV